MKHMPYIQRYLILVFISLPILSFSNTFVLDPINGSLSNPGTANQPWPSLSEIIAAGYIKTLAYSPLPYDSLSQLNEKNSNGFVNHGDTLLLKGGLHGSIFLRNYNNESPIVVTSMDGQQAILENLHLQACSNWIFENLDISSEPYGYYLNNRLAYIESHNWQGPSKHIVIKSCNIYSAEEPWDEAQEWLNNVSSGLFIKADSCMAYNNNIYNVDMGLSCVGNYITAEYNLINNFSGDGGRVLGSYIAFNYNTIKNCYDVDDNHDDGIQSFTTNGYVVDNNEIIGNRIINTEDTSRPLNGPLQGIGCFDGFYNNWLVANNVIFVNHWHGITFLGANNCTIIHNTVIDPTPQITPGGSWIRVADHKDGRPSTGCVVANNIANQFVVDGIEETNFVVDDQSLYNDHFVDFGSFNFNLINPSLLINAGNSAYSLDLDHYNNQRDALPDIGAIEYFSPTSISNPNSTTTHLVYPNPFNDRIFIKDDSSIQTIHLFDNQQKLITSGNIRTINKEVPHLENGIYFLWIESESGFVSLRVVRG